MPPSCRLQKYLASCGLGSRRACERIIESGRVSVNGNTVVEQGVCIEPGADKVCVDGREVRPQGGVYLVLNKPRGVLSTCRDPQNRRTFADLLPDFGVRLFHAGRLDRDSEGLLILTSDGAFCHALTHPRHGTAKTYRVRVSGRLSKEQESLMTAGVKSEGETLRAASVKPAAGAAAPQYEYEVVLTEGRKRQIRRMFAAFGIAVTRLLRTRIGPLEIGSLKPGKWRRLSPREIGLLGSQGRQSMR